MELNSGPECTEGSGVKNHRYEICCKKSEVSRRTVAGTKWKWHGLFMSTFDTTQNNRNSSVTLGEEIKVRNCKRQEWNQIYIAFNWVSFFLPPFQVCPHKNSGLCEYTIPSPLSKDTSNTNTVVFSGCWHIMVCMSSDLCPKQALTTKYAHLNRMLGVKKKQTILLCGNCWSGQQEAYIKVFKVRYQEIKLLPK